MTLAKIEKKTVRQAVYEQLRESIITAELFPGEPITLQQLANKFEVSQMPIREALWQLEAEGIVVIDQNKSMWVNRLTLKEYEEITSIRIDLETKAAVKGCSLRTEADVAKLKTVMEEMQASIDNPMLYLNKNRQLHFGIYESADSPALVRLINQLWTRVGPYIIISLFEEGPMWPVSLRCHQRMYEAFIKRDARGMKEALVEDIGTATDRIRPFLENPEKIDSLKDKFLSKRAVQTEES
jgi:DNA-binding GntR family transcriptional regulator